jgi:putative membrane protein
MKISRLGEAPDYRFSLANERTFWRGSARRWAFLPRVGLDQLAPDFATPLIREVLALLLCLFAGGWRFMAICAGCATRRRCA